MLSGLPNREESSTTASQTHASRDAGVDFGSWTVGSGERSVLFITYSVVQVRAPGSNSPGYVGCSTEENVDD